MQIPGSVFKKIRSSGKTGYDYDYLDGCMYVNDDCRVYPIRDDKDGIYYVKDHGECIHIGRGCQQIIHADELAALLKEDLEGKL